MSTPAHDQGHPELTAGLLHEILLRTAGAQGADFRVLSFYMTAAPLGQIVRVPAKDVAAALKLTGPSVSKSVKRLREAGWLKTAYRIGNVSFYRVGPKVLSLAAAEHDPAEQEQPLATVTALPTASPYTD